MRAAEKRQARKLRVRGYSLREIAQKINCPKSSISGWVQGISLTPKQVARLKKNQDQARAKAANHPNSPKQTWSRLRNEIIETAAHEIHKKYSQYELKIVGTALYWAEGYKISKNMVNFSNSDPGMVTLMMQFFREICVVPENKFRGAINMHPHLDEEKAIVFWSKISKISSKQFHKTQFGISKASKQKRDTLPFGTFRIVVCDARLQSRLKGWAQGINNWAVSSVG